MNANERPNAIICVHCHAPNSYSKEAPTNCAFCYRPLRNPIPGPATGADDIDLHAGSHGPALPEDIGAPAFPTNKRHAKIHCVHCDVDIVYKEIEKPPDVCPFCKAPFGLTDYVDSVAVQQEIATLRIVRDTEGNVVGSFAFDAEQLSTHDLRGVVAELQVINQLLTSTIISLEGMGTDGSTKTKN